MLPHLHPDRTYSNSKHNWKSSSGNSYHATLIVRDFYIATLIIGNSYTLLQLLELVLHYSATIKHQVNRKVCIDHHLA